MPVSKTDDSSERLIMIESRAQNFSPEMQSTAWLQRAEFKDFIDEMGGDYSDQEPNYEVGQLNLVLFQWLNRDTKTGNQNTEYHIAQVIEKTKDKTGALTVKIDADPSGKSITIPVSDPAISAFGTIRLTSEPEHSVKRGLSIEPLEEASPKTRLANSNSSHNEMTNLLRRKLITATALAGTAITLMNSSPPTAAASVSRDGTRSSASAPLMHSTHKTKPEIHHKTSIIPPIHEQNMGTEIVVLKRGGSLWNIAKATGLPISPELHAIEKLNKREIAKAGGVDDLPAGLKIEVPIKINPEHLPVHKTQSNVPKPETRSFVLKKGESLWGIGEEVERDRETNLTIANEVESIIDTNQISIDKYGGVDHLPAGLEVIVPIDQNPSRLPAKYIQSMLPVLFHAG